MVSADGDLRTVGVLLLRANLADNKGVGDLFTSVGRYVILFDNKEGIHSFDTLSCSLCITSYPLA